MKEIQFKSEVLDYEDLVIVTITHQTHIENAFSDQKDNMDHFEASNGLTLQSCSYPEMSELEQTVYVWGGGTGKNSTPLHMTLDFFENFKQAVEEYNNFHCNFLQPRKFEKLKVGCYFIKIVKNELVFGTKTANDTAHLGRRIDVPIKPDELIYQVF